MESVRLYTEKKENLTELASQQFESFTLYDAIGAWKGTTENSVIIEIIANDDNVDSVWHAAKGLAEIIKRINRQQAVMLTRQNVNMELI